MNFLKKMFEKFKNLPDKEKKNVIVSVIFTLTVHFLIIFSLSYVKDDDIESVKKPKFIKARILIKGVKDGKNSYNAKTNKIRTKKKKYLPDKITKKVLKKKNVVKNEKKSVKKISERDKNTIALGKKKNEKNKHDKIKKNNSENNTQGKELTDEERAKLLLSSISKINPAIPDDKKGDKNGDLGKRKGAEGGSEDGNETDPSKVLAGSLYERRVASGIKAIWKIPVLDESLKKKLIYKIRIYINKDGSFKFITIKKSGNVFFDDSVINTLKSIDKVEAPPENFADFYKNKGFIINFFPKI